MNQKALFELYEMLAANRDALSEPEREKLQQAEMYVTMFCSVVSQIATRKAGQ